MLTAKFSNLYRSGLAALSTAALFLTGCALQGTGTPSAPLPVAGIALAGSVHGGQQPVSAAAIQLYAASTGGYAATSYPLLNTSVLTDVNGNFSITGDYSCPSASAPVYIVGVGGNSGGGTNANLTLMTALGPCGNLSPSTYISINEITTVASVWALSPFMGGYSNIGTSSTNVQGLNNAFASVNKLANIGGGVVAGPALPAGAVLPVTEIYTLADILAACVNTTGGIAGDSSACGKLFSASTPAGAVPPTDIIGAAINIARNPARNVTSLYNLVAATAPFQPTLTASPTDWTISVTYSGGGFSAPSASALDSSSNLWVTNALGNSVSVLSPSGAPVSGSPYTTGGINGPSSIAIDPGGTAWITNKTNSTVTALTNSGQPFNRSPFSGGGLSAPTGVAIDGQGFVWVTNSGNSTVTELNASGGVLSGFGYTGAGISAPVAIAINPH